MAVLANMSTAGSVPFSSASALMWVDDIRCLATVSSRPAPDTPMLWVKMSLQL